MFWVNVSVNIWVNVWVKVSVNVWVNVSVNIWVNVWVKVCINVWVNVCVNVWVNVCVNVCVNEICSSAHWTSNIPGESLTLFDVPHWILYCWEPPLMSYTHHLLIITLTIKQHSICTHGF